MISRFRQKQKESDQATKIRKMPIKKFVFTNSPKALAMHHKDQQFVDIIDNKKIYQSMIKDQLRKLDSLETCIPDPEVQQFILPQDPKQINTLRNIKKTQIKDKQNNQKTKHKNIRNQFDQKQIDVDFYLQKQIDSKYNKLLQKKIKMNSELIFFKFLKDNLKCCKNNKAVKYFYQENITKKYFYYLKTLVEDDIKILVVNQQKTEKLKKLILTNQIKIFKKYLKKSILQKRINVTIRLQQFRLKKANLISIYTNYSKNKKIDNSVNLFLKYLKRKSFQKIILRKQLITINKQNNQKLLKKIKYNSFKKLITNLKTNNENKNQNISSLVKQFQNKIKITQSNQNQFITFCKNKRLSNSIKKQMQIKLKQNQLQLLICNKQQKKKQFEKHEFVQILRTKLKMQKLNNMFSLRSIEKIQIKFIQKMKQIFNLNKNLKLIQKNHIKYYINNFVHNSQQDIKYANSMMKCLNGSKNWLIKNKHIFKAEPIINKQQNQIEKNNQQNQNYQQLLQKQFRHPLAQLSIKQWIKKQSKFKKFNIKFSKWVFIKNLCKKYQNRKKNQMMIFAMEQIKKQKNIKRIWLILSNKKLIQNINKQINQQIEAELTFNETQKLQQLQKKLQIIKMQSLFKTLQTKKQFINKTNLLENFIKKTKIKLIFVNLRFYIQNANIKQQLLSKHQLVKHKILSANFNKFYMEAHRQFTANQKMIKIKSIYNQIKENKNLSSQNEQQNNEDYQKITAQIIQKKGKVQFLNLLKMNSKLNNCSALITKNYLKNMLKLLQNYKNNMKKSRKLQQIINKREHNLKREYLLSCKANMEEKILNRNRLSYTINNIFKTKCNYFINSLFKFLLEKENQQNIEILSHQVTEKIKKIRLNNFFNQLKVLNDRRQNNSNKQFQNQNKDQGQIELNQQNNQLFVGQSNQNKLEKPNQNSNLNKLQQYLQFSPAKSNNSNSQKDLSQSVYKKKMTQEYEMSPLFKSSNNVREQNSIYQSSNENSQSVYQNISQDNQLSYQKYRKSHIQKQNKYNSQQQSIHENQHKNFENKIFVNKLNNSEISNQNCKQQQQIQKSCLQNSLQHQKSQNISNDIFNQEYFINKYNDKITKKYFKNWKKHNKIDKDQEQKNSQQTYQMLKKAFQGLRMITRQKILVKKYLREYEEQLHYYPHSLQQYIQFKQIAESS